MRASPRRALLARFEAQGETARGPSHLSVNERQENRLSRADVVGQLEAILSAQHGEDAKRERLQRRGLLPGPGAPKREQVGLVKGGGQIRLKGYTPKARASIARQEENGAAPVRWSVACLAISDASLPEVFRSSRFAKVVERKRRLRRRHEGDVMQTEPPAGIMDWCGRLTIEHPDREGLALVHLSGPGTVYLQSLPLRRLAARLQASSGGSGAAGAPGCLALLEGYSLASYPSENCPPLAFAISIQRPACTIFTASWPGVFAWKTPPPRRCAA